MSLAWFSVHNLTMFQISATAGNLCSKTVSEIHTFGEKVLCQLCWNCAILISSTASQIRGADYFVGKKKRKRKKNVMSNLCNFNFLWHGSPTRGKGGTVFVEVPVRHLDWRGKNKFVQPCLLHPQRRWAGKLITHTLTKRGNRNTRSQTKNV